MSCLKLSCRASKFVKSALSHIRAKSQGWGPCLPLKEIFYIYIYIGGLGWVLVVKKTQMVTQLDPPL